MLERKDELELVTYEDNIFCIWVYCIYLFCLEILTVELSLLSIFDDSCSRCEIWKGRTLVRIDTDGIKLMPYYRKIVDCLEVDSSVTFKHWFRFRLVIRIVRLVIRVFRLLLRILVWIILRFVHRIAGQQHHRCHGHECKKSIEFHINNF